MGQSESSEESPEVASPASKKSRKPFNQKGASEQISNSVKTAGAKSVSTSKLGPKSVKSQRLDTTRKSEAKSGVESAKKGKREVESSDNSGSQKKLKHDDPTLVAKKELIIPLTAKKAQKLRREAAATDQKTQANRAWLNARSDRRAEDLAVVHALQRARGMTVRVPVEHAVCETCRLACRPEVMLLCDKCNDGYHTYCLSPPLSEIPDGNWFCRLCTTKSERNSPIIQGADPPGGAEEVQTNASSEQAELDLNADSESSLCPVQMSEASTDLPPLADEASNDSVPSRSGKTRIDFKNLKPFRMGVYFFPHATPVVTASQHLSMEGVDVNKRRSRI